MKRRLVRQTFYLMAILSVMLIKIGFSQEDIRPNPTRPSASDNAYLTHLGYTELEFGFLSQTNFQSLPLLFKFTFHKNFELGLTMSGLIDRINGEYDFGNPGLQLKTQLIDQSWGAVAAAGRIEYIESAKPTYTVYGVASLLFEKISLDGTLGGVFSDQGSGDYSDVFTYAFALNSNFESPLGGFLEIFGVNSDFSNPVYFDCGISYGISKNVILDLSITFGLNDESEDWVVQVGFTTLLYKLLK